MKTFFVLSSLFIIVTSIMFAFRQCTMEYFIYLLSIVSVVICSLGLRKQSKKIMELEKNNLIQ